MSVRLARSRFARLAPTAVWLVLVAGMGVVGAPVSAGHSQQDAVPPASVREVALDRDEAPGAPTRPMRALSSGTVRLTSRGPYVGARSRSAGGATLAADSPVLATRRVSTAGLVDEYALPGIERAWSPSGIRGPPA